MEPLNSGFPEPQSKFSGAEGKGGLWYTAVLCLKTFHFAALARVSGFVTSRAEEPFVHCGMRKNVDVCALDPRLDDRAQQEQLGKVCAQHVSQGRPATALSTLPHGAFPVALLQHLLLQ